MRQPGERAELDQQLAPLEPVPVAQGPAAGAAVSEPEDGAATVEPIAPKGSGRTAFALQEGDLVLPAGLVVRKLPGQVRVWKRDGEPVWELTDRRERLVALVRAQLLSTLARAEGQTLLDATRTVRARVRREGWGSGATDVLVDRFTSETHVYTIERRAKGTDWIPAGLELGSR